MKDGQKILFHGEGDQEPELEPGDVIIVLDLEEHSVFQRRGHDLLMKMIILLSEALCGFKKTIQTLDRRILVITSKSGDAESPALQGRSGRAGISLGNWAYPQGSPGPLRCPLASLFPTIQ